MTELIEKILCFLGLHNGITFVARGKRIGFKCERKGCKYKTGITL